MTPRNTVEGAYVPETPAGVALIAMAATSIAAFVGYTQKGPVHQPVRILSLRDFEAEFGSVSASNAAISVAQFFMNGGGTAWIVRVVGCDQENNPTVDELIGSQADGTGMYGSRRPAFSRV